MILAATSAGRYKCSQSDRSETWPFRNIDVRIYRASVKVEAEFIQRGRVDRGKFMRTKIRKLKDHKRSKIYKQNCSYNLLDGIADSDTYDFVIIYTIYRLSHSLIR